MDEMMEYREKLMEEFKKNIRKAREGELTPTILETNYKLIESIKGIDKIMMLNGGGEYHQSNTGYGYGHGPMNRRYSMGTDWTAMGRTGYSRNARMDNMIDCLEELRTHAPNEKAKDAIDTVIAQIRLGD